MRRLLALAAAISSLAALTGCSQEEASAAERLQSAPSNTAEAGSAAVEMTVSGPGFEVTSEGTMAMEEERGSMTMSLGGGGEVVGDALTIDLIFDGLITYQRSALFGELPNGAEWVRVDAEALNEAQTGIDVGELQQTSNNPADMLASLEAVSENGVEEVGTDEVRGQEATHYEATIDIVAALEDADAVTDQEQFEQFAQIYGDEPMTVDVWLDGDGRAVRQNLVMEIEGEEIEVGLELFDFGTEVDIDVPDDGEWVDITELLPG